MSAEKTEFFDHEEVITYSLWGISDNLGSLIEEYGSVFLLRCIGILYSLYLQFTFINLAIFSIKYVPTGIYTYKYIKNMYVTFRERLREKKMELEDLQLQIEIVTSKLSVHDAEFIERSVLLRHDVERLRKARTRVRAIVAGNATMKKRLKAAAAFAKHIDNNCDAKEANYDIITDLFKRLKYHGEKFEKADSGEFSGSDFSPEQSVYSSLDDLNENQECRVKVLRVTNVYKVSYLKHFIKQKRLRRANKRATLTKKMENIKKLLENWQKTLNMVINSKLTLLNLDNHLAVDSHHIEVASQEAMGDYSKPRESFDYDSELRNNELYYDEYNLTWTQSPCRPYGGYEDGHEPNQRKHFEPHDFGDTRYSQTQIGAKYPKMMSIMEESSSQAEDITSEDSEVDCRDIIAI